MDPAAFLAGHPVALSIYDEVCDRLGALGAFDVRTTKSQIAFRRTRGFAYIWLPGQYLQNPGAEVVLSIALGREVRSGRFKEVVHPAEGHWMHHLEVHHPDEIDDEVVEWLREAFERAGRRAPTGAAVPSSENDHPMSKRPAVAQETME